MNSNWGNLYFLIIEHARTKTHTISNSFMNIHGWRSYASLQKNSRQIFSKKAHETKTIILPDDVYPSVA